MSAIAVMLFTILVAISAVGIGIIRVLEQIRDELKGRL